ncbi:MAG TPA: iron ABC transporter permease [Devosia sp.]|nr:iron ABC transporter permease [Devosia sp.]
MGADGATSRNSSGWVGKPARPFPRFGTLLVGAIALIIGMPVLALLAMALGASPENLGALWRTVLPRSSLTTLILLAGLAVFAGSIGAISAWLVTFFDFPGRRLFAWALMLPLAVPTYISAYAFTEFFTYTGPVQALVRDIGGFSTSRDYWFPDIRSTGGAVLVLSAVLYPYVYMSVRALFLSQGRRAIEAGLALGAGQGRILGRILLPLARPALALGIILAMMEAVNDIGAMEYLGVNTLTFSIFSLWTNQGDMGGAAQLAVILLVLVLALIGAERLARRRQSYISLGTGGDAFARLPLRGGRAALAFVLCLLPVLAGFGIPFITFAGTTIRAGEFGISGALLNALATSFSLSALAALIAVLLALLLRFTLRTHPIRILAVLARIAASGYAMPGTLIGLGILVPLAMLDNFIDSQMRALFSVSTGLLITGSGATIVYAYVIRFMAAAEGTIDAGMKRISTSLDEAARCFGYSNGRILLRILVPLLHPALATAALLVFIESLKELSATLVLRPFGVETLSIRIHDLASRGRIEEVGMAALLLLLAGIIPAILLSRSSLKDR